MTGDDDVLVGQVHYGSLAAQIQAIRHHMDVMLFTDHADTVYEARYAAKRRDEFLRAMPGWMRVELYEAVTDLAQVLENWPDESP